MKDLIFLIVWIVFIVGLNVDGSQRSIERSRLINDLIPKSTLHLTVRPLDPKAKRRNIRFYFGTLLFISTLVGQPIITSLFFGIFILFGYILSLISYSPLVLR